MFISIKNENPFIYLVCKNNEGVIYASSFHKEILSTIIEFFNTNHS
jgi:hypothetical protein